MANNGGGLVYHIYAGKLGICIYTWKEWYSSNALSGTLTYLDRKIKIRAIYSYTFKNQFYETFEQKQHNCLKEGFKRKTPYLHTMRDVEIHPS